MQNMPSSMREKVLRENRKRTALKNALEKIVNAYFIILNKIDELDGTNEKLLEEHRKYIEKCIKL